MKTFLNLLICLKLSMRIIHKRINNDNKINNNNNNDNKIDKLSNSGNV